ncbi:DUF7343 domain-containing protein [Haloarchaeobius sp. DFWS5]|uniref:helix-turn-helix transcriptional regulator n=1 Tax=Haloarchaeobius sp. DFWS5 TaxID=3446114 RepID=UPI003EBD17CB
MSSYTTIGRIFVCLLLVVAGAAVPVGAETAASSTASERTPASVSVADAYFTGDAVVDYNTSGDRTFLWQSANQTLNVRLAANASENASQPVTVCLQRPSGDPGTSSDRAPCTEATLEGNETTVELTTQQWPFNTTGAQNVTVVAKNNGTVFDWTTLDVYVISKDGDIEPDGLTNAEEIEAGTNLTVSDTDEDTLPDGEEVKNYGSSPLSKDTDDDGLKDPQEVSGDTNVNKSDTDDDGLNDSVELEMGLNATSPDTDNDGITDADEVNEVRTDPAKADTDGDGLEDLEELKGKTNATLADTDGDGLNDSTELEELGTSPIESDTDGDLLSDKLESDIGTSPTSALSPWGFLLVGLLVLAVAALSMGGRFETSGLQSTVDRLLDRRRTDDGAVTASADVDDSSSMSATDTEPVPDHEPEPVPPSGTDDPMAVMTDEGRVKQILRDNGGRLQQKEIIEETDWSKSKVSRLLSKMEKDDQIRKISVGRENLITLPEDEPEGSRPFF